MVSHYIYQQTSWPQFTWDTTVLQPQLNELRVQQGKLLGQLSLLPTENESDAYLDTLIQTAIRTSEIEGENLNVSSVRSSVAKQLGLLQAGLPPSTSQTDALVEMLLDATTHHARSLTLDKLFEWQAALFPNNDKALNPVVLGALRGDEPMQVISGRIDKPIIHFEAPSRDQLEEELEQFLLWFNHPPKNLDALLRAGIAHLWFITLHPFDDGNGRVARAITDRALAQAEHQSVRFYSLSASIMARRNEYYNVLEAAQKGNLDITLWLSWFLTVLQGAINEGLHRFERVLKKARYWQTHAQTSLTQRQIKVLNRLLDAGVGTEYAEEFELGINASKYMSLAKVSKATATRELADLLEKGCIEKLAGGGRSTRYTLKW